MKENEPKVSGKDTALPDNADLHSECISYYVDLEKRKVDAAELWFSQLRNSPSFFSKIQDAFDTIENGKEVWGQ